MIARLTGFLRADAALDGLAPPPAVRVGGVPLVAAILAFLAVLLMGLALAAGTLASDWRGARADTATLQVFAGPDEIEEQARAALEVLKATPGVTGVRMIDLAEQERLLEPWLGPDIPLENLPLPVTIEVITDRDSFNAAALAEGLKVDAPGAVLDDHAAWRVPLVRTAERLALFAWGGMALAGLLLAAVLGLAARGAVAAGGPAVRTLRLVGARDGVIVRAFTRPLVRGATLGAVAGTLAGMALLAVLPRASEQGFFLTAIGLGGWHWLVPVLIPFGALVLAWGGAARAARRSLRAWS